MSGELAASTNTTQRLSRLCWLALCVECIVAPGCDEHETAVPVGAGGSTGNGASPATSEVGGKHSDIFSSTLPFGTDASGGTGASAANATTLPAEGSVSVAITTSATATSGYACIDTHTLTLGNEPPTVTTLGSAWVDGQGGKTVTCSIGPNSSSNVAVKISGNSADFQLTAKSIVPGGDNGATVSLFDTRMALNLYDEHCRIDASSGNFSVSGDGLWLGINCEHLISKDDSHLWCALNGIVAVSNCTAR